GLSIVPSAASTSLTRQSATGSTPWTGSTFCNAYAGGMKRSCDGHRHQLAAELNCPFGADTTPLSAGSTLGAGVGKVMFDWPLFPQPARARRAAPNSWRYRAPCDTAARPARTASRPLCGSVPLMQPLPTVSYITIVQWHLSSSLAGFSFFA